MTIRANAHNASCRQGYETSTCGCDHPACCACRDRRAAERKAAKADEPTWAPYCDAEQLPTRLFRA